MSNPSLSEADGRDTKGRFAPGNKASKGNPHAKRVNRLRTTILKAVTPAEMREVIAELLTKAKCGDVAAIKLLFEYTIGKPKEQVEVDAVGGGLTFIVRAAEKKGKDEDEQED